MSDPRTIKVVYLNDTLKKQVLFQETLHKPLKVLQPTEYVVVSMLLADDQVVFVKMWPNNTVLIGKSDGAPETDGGE
jgi:hypothetical protein